MQVLGFILANFNHLSQLIPKRDYAAYLFSKAFNKTFP